MTESKTRISKLRNAVISGLAVTAMFTVYTLSLIGVTGLAGSTVAHAGDRGRGKGNNKRGRGKGRGRGRGNSVIIGDGDHGRGRGRGRGYRGRGRGKPGLSIQIR